MIGKQQQETSTDAVQIPSEPVRSVITLLLILHMFCVCVALCANWQRSPLQNGLKRVLAPYIQTLYLDPDDTRYHLTHAEPHDVNNFIQVNLTQDSGETWSLRLPQERQFHAGKPLKRARSLADILAFWSLNENEEIAGMIARCVASHAVADYERVENISNGARMRGEIICRQHIPQSIEDVRRGTPRQRNPNDLAFFRNAYEADIVVDRASGQIHVHRRRDSGQVAPAGE